MIATIKYDFSSSEWPWLAVADWNDDLHGVGATPQEAVDNLRRQCDKHGLWKDDPR